MKLKFCYFEFWHCIFSTARQPVGVAVYKWNRPYIDFLYVMYRHTAARQDNYNSVIMLLARGADVMVVNKLGESCIDCVPQKGSSYSAIALNVHILAVRGSPSRKRILNKYIYRQPLLHKYI